MLKIYWTYWSRRILFLPLPVSTTRLITRVRRHATFIGAAFDVKNSKERACFIIIVRSGSTGPMVKKEKKKEQNETVNWGTFRKWAAVGN